MVAIPLGKLEDVFNPDYLLFLLQCSQHDDAHDFLHLMPITNLCDLKYVFPNPLGPDGGL